MVAWFIIFDHSEKIYVSLFQEGREKLFLGPNTSFSTEVSLNKSFHSNENQTSHIPTERMQIGCSNMNVDCINVGEESVSTCVSKNETVNFQLSCCECKKKALPLNIICKNMTNNITTLP